MSNKTKSPSAQDSDSIDENTRLALPRLNVTEEDTAEWARRRPPTIPRGLSTLAGIARMRDVLREPGTVVRLIGLSGVGKTRLVQALFDARIGARALDHTLALYTNMSDDPDPGIPVAQIYRAGNNPLLDRLIARFRGDRGELIPKGPVAARRAIAALRRGTHLTLLADQKMNDGIPVPFFGRPAMTAPALAVLALCFDCDVLPARVERLAGARFRLTVFPPLPLPRSGEPHADAVALMARVNATLEAWVRDRPEQWLWVHRRWPD